MSTMVDQLIRRIVTTRDTQKYAWVIGVFVVAWIVGKSIAGMRFGIPLTLLGFLFFLLAFFRKHSLAYLFPLILVVPNIGLDIPGPWAITVEDAFVLLIFGGYLSRCILRRQYVIPRDDKIIVPLLIFNGIAILCLTKVLVVSPWNLTFNIKELMRLTLLNLFYLAMIDALDSKKQVLTLVKWLLICAAWMMAVSYYIYLTRSPFWYWLLTMQPAYIFLKTKILRMISIAGSTSFTGIYYAIILSLAFHFLPMFRQRLQRLGGAFYVLLIFSCVFLTFNRGTWVGILFGMTVLMLHGQIDWRRVALSILLIIGMVALSTTELFGEFDVDKKIMEFLYYSSSSAESRLVRWASSINLILEHPILGVGFNNYAFVYGRYSILEGIQPMYGSPHNMYVDVLTGTGFVGFSVFLLVLVRLWKRMRDNMMLVVDPELRLLSRGIFLAFLFFLGSGGFDSFLFKPHHSSYLIWSLFAMSTAIYRLRLQAPAESGQTDSSQTEPSP